MKIATTAQLREIDIKASEQYELPTNILTENAAIRVVEAMAARFSPLVSKGIAVVCGTGNNGQDGLAIARHLHTRFGCLVTVGILAGAQKEADNAAMKRATANGLVLVPALKIDFPIFDLIVDALFGTGLHGAVTGAAASLILAMNESCKQIVAVDIPSGLMADSGITTGPVVRAALTVTFTFPKFGLLEYPGAEFVGDLVVADICLPKKLLAAVPSLATATEPRDVAEWLPKRKNGRDANKGSYGHVAIFAGSAGFAGAPILAAEAAARAGAGLVTLVVPVGLQKPVMALISPSIMTNGLIETSRGTFGPSALEEALAVAKKVSVVAIGPGLGTGQEVATFIREFITRCPVPLVIDADALNALAKEADQGASITRSRTSATILTPHPGEMGRLLGIETALVQDNRRNAATQGAAKFGCVVLLKGARTLIAGSDGALFLNQTGNAGMATGGAGDALTGLIAGYLGQHLEPIRAAAAAAFIHGLAGEIASNLRGGAIGLIATDLIEQFPRALARCHEKVTAQ
jgi:hydroxyethylthiazole kinase-like uncharacterized protein yjeF